jgi:hypothetical protein
MVNFRKIVEFGNEENDSIGIVMMKLIANQVVQNEAVNGIDKNSK